MKADEASSTAYRFHRESSTAANILQIESCTTVTLESNDFILRSSRAGRKLLRRLDNPVQRLLLRIFERLTLPGMAFHYVLRKMYIEDCVRRAIEEGAKQVVILGAGFDTLSLGLSKEFNAIRFIEVDHPATAKDKNEALIEQIKSTNNYYFAAVDFSRESLLDAYVRLSIF